MILVGWICVTISGAGAVSVTLMSASDDLFPVLLFGAQLETRRRMASQIIERRLLLIFKLIFYTFVGNFQFFR